MDCGLRWFVCFFCLCGCEEDLTSTWFTFWREDHQRYENLLDPKDTKPSEYCTKRYENLLDPRSRSKIRKPFGSKSYGGKLEVGSFRILAGKDFHQKDRRTGRDRRWRKDRVDDRIQNQNGDGEVIDNIHIDFQSQRLSYTLAILLSPNLSPSIA